MKEKNHMVEIQWQMTMLDEGLHPGKVEKTDIKQWRKPVEKSRLGNGTTTTMTLGNKGDG